MVMPAFARFEYITSVSAVATIESKMDCTYLIAPNVK